MNKLTREDLYSLEKYTEMRKAFREEVMAHKLNRRLAIGPNATLYFEDRLTIHYQVQEMLRIEKIFQSDEIDEELAAYNPLIPDGSNWKATFMIEFADEEERRQALKELVEIESYLWMRINDNDLIKPVADEDLERTKQDKTSAVHFLRFELTGQDVADLKDGAVLSAGIDHAAYNHTVETVPENIRKSLLNDLA